MRKAPTLFFFVTLHALATEPQVYISQPTAQEISRKAPAQPLNIAYLDGQLTIDAHNVTLAEVLTQVAALTGVIIDLPEGADREPMQVVKLGPGSAREVLSSLLSDSSFDYVIQASDSDSDKLQSVLLMPRPKKGAAGSEGSELASRNPYSRALAPPSAAEETLMPDASTQQQSAITEASASSSPIQSPTGLGSAESAPGWRSQSDSLRPGALSPPEVMTSESINQQLQQMYQQRVQLNKQTAPTSQ